MSRIGKKPVLLPDNVKAVVEGNTVRVEGPKGKLEKTFHREMIIEQVDDSTILIKRPTDNKLHRSLHGLTRTLLNNMVQGVSAGFQKNLELVGVGYRAAMQGSKLVLTVGYSHPVEIVPPEGITIEVPAATKISVKGIDKETVGAIAANIRAVREPEPYKGKGIKYEGEVIRRKVGKAGAKR
ncbi:large subunit ribosomal protein L6 [Desulfotomaculum arcticum]|uniref:Large ribosomal subunit protein uL6 n=1 Tax=Desulfotruncus arcticus DSM 17038 TaxID=1121424 RepID=A0A1I2W3G8_9FIRM|nr:50S ribosomal protein L6 [Desulfotruncus arcticus]SFG95189.1 large subunit ribosomal protein L6 [Desulfotomaculum arcticum] [Desulfotruncus arcticus DSM 17038]